jgi:hypothetical protein
MVDQGRGYSSCQRIQKVLYRIRCLILARHDGGFVCIQDKSLGMGNLLTSTVKAADGSSVMATTDPFVVNPEFGLGKVRVFTYYVYHAPNLFHVHAIHDFLI